MRTGEHQESRITATLLGGAKISIILISVLMVLVTLAQVIFRYIFSAPLPWSEELARYCFVWIVFLGGALGLSRGVHLGVDLLVNRFSVGVQRALNILVSILIACFAGAITYASIPVIRLNMFQHSPALGAQMSWIYISIPVSMCLIVLISIERIVSELRSNSNKSE